MAVGSMRMAMVMIVMVAVSMVVVVMMIVVMMLVVMIVIMMVMMRLRLAGRLDALPDHPASDGDNRKPGDSSQHLRNLLWHHVAEEK